MSRILPALLCTLATGAAAHTYDRIEVRGAKLIPEDDIRNTCAVEPGFMDEIDLQAIDDCLMSTAVFEDVRLIPEGDTLVIDVTEIEQRPGRIEGDVSYVSDRGLTVGLSYEQYNLIPNTFTALRFDVGAEDQALEASLYHADMWGEDLDFGIHVRGLRTDYDDQAYDAQSIRIEPYVAWTPSDALRGELGVGWRSHRQFDAEDAFLLAEEGRVDAAYLRASLVWSVPREDALPAFRARLDHYLWNLGTSDTLAETRARLTFRHAFGGTELVLGLNGGAVYGGETRAIDRFHIGGEDFRGFAARGLGPETGGDLLGGDRYLIGSVEVQRDLGQAFDQTFRGGVFFDIGSVWGVDGAGIDDGWHTRSSIGLSLNIEIGPTPVSIYVAEPLVYREGDDRQQIGLRISAAL